MSSTQKRIRNDLLEKVNTVKWRVKNETSIDVPDADIINALIYHYVFKLTSEEVKEYRKKYLGKDE